MTDSAELEQFRALQASLPDIWATVHDEPRQPHSCVIVPSLSFDQEELMKVAGVPFYEERLLFLLMRLRRPGARVLYVTSQPVDPDVVDYYLHMLQGVPGVHAKRRLTMLCCHDASPRALTEKIIERPRMLRRIRDWIGDPSRAYVTCFNTSPLERKLACELGVPLNGVDPQLADLGTKSGSRRVFREAGVELSPGYEDLRTIDEVVARLDDLKQANPELERAVVKLDDSFSGEGNALFRYPELPADQDARRQTIRENLDKLQFAAADHPAQVYLDKFESMGGIVEEFLIADEVESPSVQLRITPLGHLHIISTHDQALGGESGQVYLGCKFPAAEDYRTEIVERAHRIGEILKQRGANGRFAIDFLAYRKKGEPWKFAAIEINLRMGGTTFPFVALEFLIHGALDVSGDYRSTNTGMPKYYFATDALVSPAYRGLLPQDFLEIVIEHGLHFRPATETGVLFHMIGALSEFGKVGVVCIGNSPEEAEVLYRRTKEVLDDETDAMRGDRGRLASMFNDYPHMMD